ncbi:MAG: NUDIX hydrolase [Romboutsia sp.]|nr:NUDIX hydrolase [Romboutsia sp.]
MFTLKVNKDHFDDNFPHNRSYAHDLPSPKISVDITEDGQSLVLTHDENGFDLYHPNINKPFTMSKRWIESGYTPKIGSFAFVTNSDGQMLFVVKKRGNMLYIPGGLADLKDKHTESDDGKKVLLNTVIREVKEVSGVILNSDLNKDILFSYESIYPANGENVSLHNMMGFFSFYPNEIKEITATITDTEEIKEVLWLDPHKLESYKDKYNIPQSMTYLLEKYFAL